MMGGGGKKGKESNRSKTEASDVDNKVSPGTKKSLKQIFSLSVVLSCVCAGEEREAVKAREGATVTLQTRETRSDNEQIVWTFGPENLNMRIATVKKAGVKADYDERFRDRLQLDLRTGALTITQLRVTDSGFYTWQSISSHIIFHHFNLTVYSEYHTQVLHLNLSGDERLHGWSRSQMRS